MTEQEWLNSDEHKIILVDIAYHDGTDYNAKYFASYPYVMKFGDSFTNILGNTTSNIAYDDIVYDVSNITTRIDSSKSLGSLTLLNTDGTYDTLLDIANSWEGHPIKIYIGDPKWFRKQFILILEGVIDSLTVKLPLWGSTQFKIHIFSLFILCPFFTGIVFCSITDFPEDLIGFLK